MIDFHAHILPGVDHGSHDLAESTAQLALLKQAGVETVVASSHFYPAQHTVEGYLARSTQALEALMQIGEDQLPRICRGAEVLLCESLDKMDGVEKLCVEGSSCMLLELPFASWSDGLIDTAFRMIQGDFTVVLAHIDRYRDRLDIIDEMLAAGAKAQLNAEGLCGMFAAKRWKRYLENGSVVALGSDLHGADQKAVERFASLQKKLGGDHAKIMASTAEILADAVRY